MYDDILDKLQCPLIIWNLKDDKLICEYHNNYIKKIVVGIDNSEYIKQDDKKFEETYLKCINNIKIRNDGEKQIKHNEYIIFINRINNNKILEVHYPEYNETNLLGVISHKIRGPLTNIIGIITLLGDSDLNNRVAEFIDIIKKSSYEIINVVNDIVDLINFSKNKVKLRKIISSSYSVIKTKIQKKGLHININVDKNIPDVVRVDKGKLKQILVNLMDNSIQFTEHGNISIDIILFDNDKLNNYPETYKYIKCNKPKYNILFKIKDTGFGINNAKKDMINKIITNDNIIKTPYYCGFGIILCKYICDLMGGNIWFKSEKDIGTIFYFNIICDGISIDKF